MEAARKGMRAVSNAPTGGFVSDPEPTSYGSGLFGLELPSRPLDEDESKVLDRLFPTTMAQVERLLDTEALVSAEDHPPASAVLKAVVSLNRNGHA